MRAGRIAAVGVLALTLAGLGVPGLAADRGGGVELLSIYFDSPGSDTGSPQSLRNEKVVISNSGSGPVNMSGWTLRDLAGHVYRFPTFTLAAGTDVIVHTGSGRNTARHLYWGSGWYIWNNDGDMATLKRRNGTPIDSCSYSGSGSVATC